MPLINRDALWKSMIDTSHTLISSSEVRSTLTFDLAYLSRCEKLKFSWRGTRIAIVLHHDVALPDFWSGAPIGTTWMTTLLIDLVPLFVGSALSKRKIAVAKGFLSDHPVGICICDTNDKILIFEIGTWVIGVGVLVIVVVESQHKFVEASFSWDRSTSWAIWSTWSNSVFGNFCVRNFSGSHPAHKW